MSFTESSEDAFLSVNSWSWMRLFAGKIIEHDLIARLLSNLKGFQRTCSAPCRRNDLGSSQRGRLVRDHDLANVASVIHCGES